MQPRGLGIESPDYVWNEAEVEALEFEGDIASGEQLFAEQCESCHSAEGAGQLDGSVPKIAAQHETVIVKQLADILGGRRDSQASFQALAGLDTPEKVADVGAYVASLPVRLASGKGPGDPAALELGEMLHQRDCSPCHRRIGQGMGERYYPKIGGQHYNYLTTQLRDIAVGRRRNALPTMMAIVRSYSDEELSAVADYLSRLDWPETELE